MSLANVSQANIPLTQKNHSPDTTINNLLALSNENSAKNFYPLIDSVSLINEDSFNSMFDILDNHPFVIFVNSKQTEYLIAFFHEGGTHNSFNEFQIGYLTKDIIKKINSRYIKTQYNSFYTNSGLHLGISQKTLQKIKGNHYKKEENTISLYIK